MKLEQALLELETPQVDPTAAIEYLIAEKRETEGALLSRLATLRAGIRPPLTISFALPHAPTHRIYLRIPLGFPDVKTEEALRRMVIALGAMRSIPAVPYLLDLIARSAGDVSLNETVGWALAAIGEAALLPLYRFARNRRTPTPARSLAIASIGYIPDLRTPTILNNLCREYQFEEPGLAIVALLALTTCGLFEEAHQRAVETVLGWRTWNARHADQRGVGFEFAADTRQRSLETAPQAKPLAAWSRVLQTLGHR
jgi:hypothetical protein